MTPHYEPRATAIEHTFLPSRPGAAGGTDRVAVVRSASRAVVLVEGASDQAATSQPAWRGRPVEAQLRRFIGTRSGRKVRYGRLLVDALDLTRVPRPLAMVLAHVRHRRPQPDG